MTSSIILQTAINGFKGGSTMSVEENKAIVRRWYEEFWNAGNIEVADELLHPDYTAEGRAAGRESLEASKEGRAFWNRVLPDIHFTLDEVVAEGDTVVVRWTARGTHRGEWTTLIGTVPASGKATKTPGTSSYRLKDGKIIGDVNHIDFLSLLQQMGAVVQPSETSR
jgi:steroid delta-isomerase-like uncharacterized protein